MDTIDDDERQAWAQLEAFVRDLRDETRGERIVDESPEVQAQRVYAQQRGIPFERVHQKAADSVGVCSAGDAVDVPPCTHWRAAGPLAYVCTQHFRVHMCDAHCRFREFSSENSEYVCALTGHVSDTRVQIATDRTALVADDDDDDDGDEHATKSCRGRNATMRKRRRVIAVSETVTDSLFGLMGATEAALVLEALTTPSPDNTRELRAELGAYVHRLFCRLFVSRDIVSVTTLHSFVQLCLVMMCEPGGWSVRGLQLLPGIPWLAWHVRQNSARLAGIPIANTVFPSRLAATQTRARCVTLVGHCVPAQIALMPDKAELAFQAPVDGVPMYTGPDATVDQTRCVRCAAAVPLRAAWITVTARCFVLPPCRHVLCEACARARCPCVAGRRFDARRYIAYDGCLVCGDPCSPHAVTCDDCVTRITTAVTDAAGERGLVDVVDVVRETCDGTPLAEVLDGVADSCHFPGAAQQLILADVRAVTADSLDIVWPDDEHASTLAAAVPDNATDEQALSALGSIERVERWRQAHVVRAPTVRVARALVARLMKQHHGVASITRFTSVTFAALREAAAFVVVDQSCRGAPVLTTRVRADNQEPVRAADVHQWLDSLA
jgi:hypothetical protein